LRKQIGDLKGTSKACALQQKLQAQSRRNCGTGSVSGMPINGQSTRHPAVKQEAL